MNLLDAKLYDPAGAVTKATSALLAMTVLDTTNLRLAITVPAHGKVRFRLAGCIHGAVTAPQIFLGVLNGATVLGRVAPTITASNLAATTLYQAEAEFTVTGLTPGALNADAAYGVETVVAATGIKYGGPNNTTANDAFGGFVFEAFDPQPLKGALDGGVNVTQFGGTAGTFAAGRPEVNTSHFGGTAGSFAAGRPEVNTSHAAGVAWGSGAITAASIAADAITAAKIADGAIDAATLAAGTITAAKFAAGAIDAAAIADNAIDAASLAADAGTEIATAVWASVTRTLTANTNLNDLSAAAVRAAIGLAAANLDTQLASIVGFIDTEVAAILAKVNALPADPADASDIAASFAVVNGVLTTLQKVLRNKTLTDPASGIMTVYDDDSVTPLLTCNVFEDVAGAQAYRGQGADRRDRLA